MPHVRSLQIPCLLSLGVALAAQAPPGPSLADAARSTSGLDSPGRARFELGRKALTRGSVREAVDHFLGCLAFEPTSPEVLAALVEASRADEDAKSLWALRYLLATADARGRSKVDRKMAADLPDLGKLKSLVGAHFAAANEVARFASKQKASRNGVANGWVARWAGDVAFYLMRDVPALRAKHGKAIEAALARHEPDHKIVVDELKKLMGSQAVPAAGQDGDNARLVAQDRAMRAARCLAGLAAQAAFEDLQGPKPPDVTRVGAAARELIEKLRGQVEARMGDPKSVAELEAMGPDARAAFTASHRSWANPGTAVSPNGKYVIQTTCGFETLLGVAQTVEMHHARIANWIGKDPFSAPGIVRVLPEFGGLESDSTPFWWAQGFQRGDATTVRFAWSSIAELGRTLTHELTHRFDGRVFAFLPAWLVEGRAVWTGDAYAAAEETEFVERFLDPWAVKDAYLAGYGDPEDLRKLLDASLDDYRDNYTAGYALFVYLASWRKDGQTLYADALQRFMKSARAGRKKPVAFFESHFADGKGGRPAGLDKFAKEFEEFLFGCYRYCWGEKDRDWLRDYQFGLDGRVQRRHRVLDDPTFSWSRDRAEPWFGQRHAALAAELLAEVGRDKPALAAAVWSLQADGLRPNHLERLATIAERLGRSDVAWAARHRIGTALGEAPMLAKLPKTRALIEALAARAAEHRAGGRGWTAAVLDARAAELRRWTGVPSSSPRQSLPDGDAPLYPMSDVPVRLGLYGWREGGLVDYESRREDGLWFETESTDLHVGRNKPRDESGLLDRRARERHAFVRTAAWHAAGRYVVRTRVHFTTSYVSGAVVLGYTRRDHNVRLGFSAGDFLYSIGDKDSAETTDSVSLDISGLWERGSNLPGARPTATVAFDKPSASFELELWVDGPTVRVVVDGKRRFTYATPDGSPIEGPIGFAMENGAIRLQQPTVQRLDRDAAQLPEAARAFPWELDPRDNSSCKLEDLMQRRVEGVPRTRHGTLVVWVPASDYAKDYAANGLRSVREHLANARDYPQRWMLALPASVDESERAGIFAEFEKAAPGRTGQLLHERSARPLVNHAWLLFVDGAGVLRAAAELSGRPARMPFLVDRWARLSRTRR